MGGHYKSAFQHQANLRTPNDLSVYFREDVLSRAKIIYGE